MKKQISRIKLLAIVIALFTTSCKKFLDIPGPETSTNQDNVYQYDNTAASVLTGLYAQMMNEFFSGSITSISLIQELAADNLVLNNITETGYLNWWRNNMTPDYFTTGGYNNYFSNFYPKIYITNAAIEGLEKSNALTPSVKQRLLGESFFLRALYYFYLVNLYGDIPIVLTSNYSQNDHIGSSNREAVYKQIEEDLQQSIRLLNDRYVDASITNNTTERLRPNISTAQALLARVQLYTKKYADAEATCTQIIDKIKDYELSPLDSVFIKNSKETIWALQPVKQNYNTDEAYVFILNSIPGTISPKLFYLSKSLLASFERNDQRQLKWISKFSGPNADYYYSSKYKVDANNSDIVEYCIVFRLAEQYLIRAESRLNQNKISGALADLNMIRQRSGLLPYASTNANDIQKMILRERRVELFTEWGHRWFDLKRSGTINSVMTEAMQYKGGTWSEHKALYPIPNSEIMLNRNITQNSGY
ncbi:RagB/SusD family nutrient uptake outer membrane protein [Chitinophaga oryzae]|uniref:RagB/SusD family nutrient uptake outer membrane protein n=1 Tax=Chitinophaga oryzae TaxID=2725414 RepID=A0AAE6ZH20_9BACT|nr:RagB/SusD family nutrient uptake outer membrane protein [Chitinophaga oryzae]QJB32623.1 RagB/SusD family nutrient uptake outer membrane protein [Chitinophaga oryzae]